MLPYSSHSMYYFGALCHCVKSKSSYDISSSSYRDFQMGIKHKMIECQGKVLEAPLLLDHEKKPVEMTEQKEISNAILSGNILLLFKLYSINFSSGSRRNRFCPDSDSRSRKWCDVSNGGQFEVRYRSFLAKINIELISAFFTSNFLKSAAKEG